MTFDELNEVLSATDFYVKESSNFKYNFSNDSIKRNRQHICKWKLLEKNDNFYLVTNQSLGDDKAIKIDIIRDYHPIELNLSFQTTNKHFITLVEE